MCLKADALYYEQVAISNLIGCNSRVLTAVKGLPYRLYFVLYKTV